MPSREHREDLARYGMDPDPWGRGYEDLIEQSETRAALAERMSRSIKEGMVDIFGGGSWGEAADDDADGEA